MEIPANSPDVYRLASKHIAKIDRDWARLVRLVGPCTHESKPAREPYEALVRAVAYQQLHARAADAIVARLLNTYPGEAFPSPQQLLATSTETLRACGFSARKIATIQGIAEAAISGLVPTSAVASGMADEELIERLIVLRGIGRWTVEMLLMYTLERVDVMPLDDFGVRDGYRLLKSLETMPTRKEMEIAGLPCSPYRTVASWYLWRVPSLVKRESRA